MKASFHYYSNKTLLIMASFFSLSNLFLQLSFLFFSLSYHSFGIQQPLCNDGERSSLLQFKKISVFDEFSCNPSTDYTKLSSWKVADDCCSWDGVYCDDQTGHVIGLDLSRSCLFGSINSTSPLFRLVHLKSLDLSSNDFNFSRIPREVIRSLSELKHLNLSSSNFSGQVPSEIMELSKLVSLDLSNNPDLIGYLPEFQLGSPLEILRLQGTNFSGQLPLSIGNLKSLRVLTAWGCGFQGLIPSSIGNLTKLEVLDLSKNYFSGNIPSSLGNLLQLTTLLLGSLVNKFSPGTLDWIGKTMTNLQYLDLVNTNSYGPIPDSFQNLTQLVELSLWDNQLTGEIPSWLGNSTQLRKLLLNQNELQGPIPDSIFRLPNIEDIDLEYNNLSGSLRYDSFLQSKYLSYLQLSKNHLSLVSNTYNNVTLPKFQFLGLGRCNLKEFPNFLREQHQLEALDLSENSIKGYAPNWIFTLENLRFLNLGNNFLMRFEHSPNDHTLLWSKLSVLYLEANELEGPLPIPPPSIALYDVSKNKFSGEVSPLFCNLTSLLVLDLSNNNLSGNSPPCLANLGTSALVLNLGKNRLSGEIADNFTSHCALMVMDFSQNKIKGEVPRSLVNCSKLEILNLEKNEMNDVFPSWLGILPRLRILSLKSNKLHGEIGPPRRRFEFSSLQIIDLSYNNFTGKLPLEYFQKWVAMKSVNNDYLAYMQTSITLATADYTLYYPYPYFISIVNKGTERAYYQILDFFVVVDLSSNQFKGEIPEIIQTLRALNSLNLSNNMLTGHIPSSLVNLKHLEALDLSQNGLSGEIPAQLSVLTSLSIFNVSHNNLTGPIPQGNQFGAFQNDSFSANPGLCGMLLSKRCGDTGTLSLPPSEDEEKESPLELNWEIVLIGLGSGLVIGVAFGFAMDTRKYEWLAKKKFARWRRRHRN